MHASVFLESIACTAYVQFHAILLLSTQARFRLIRYLALPLLPTEASDGLRSSGGSSFAALSRTLQWAGGEAVQADRTTKEKLEAKCALLHFGMSS